MKHKGRSRVFSLNMPIVLITCVLVPVWCMPAFFQAIWVDVAI